MSLRTVKRGQRLQAAMEYLMTYGWAILVIAIVLGVLYYFGVFSGGTGLPNACIPSAGFQCTAQTFSSSGYLSALVSSTASGAITVTGNACTSNVTTPSNSMIVSVGSVILQSGNQYGMSFSCGSNAGGPDGKTFSGYLWLQYNSGSQTGLIAKIALVTARVSLIEPSQCSVGTNSLTVISSNVISTSYPAVVSYTMYGGGGGGSGNNGGSASGSFVLSAGDSITVYAGGGGGGQDATGGGGGSGYYGGGGGGTSNCGCGNGGVGGGGGSSAILDNGALVQYAAGGAGNGGAANAGQGGTNTGGAGGIDTGANGGSGGSGFGGSGGGTGGSGGNGGSGACYSCSGGGGGGGYGGGGGGGGYSSGNGGSFGANGVVGSAGSGGIGGDSGTAGGNNAGGNGGSVTLTWSGSTCPI